MIPRGLRIVVAAGVLGGCLAGVSEAQFGTAGPQAASAVIARGVSDGWRSQGGVVGPWWGGGANLAGAPAADGGFWFGWPGLGFGGTSGSTRGLGATAPSVTMMPGVPAAISATRQVPFVTGVVPVVGFAAPVVPVTMAPVIVPTAAWGFAGATPEIPAPALGVSGPGAAPVPRSAGRASRDRALGFIAAGDERLRDGGPERPALRAALAAYRRAAALVADDPDIHVRQALVHEALGESSHADRAVARAVAIDGRLMDSPPRPVATFDPAFGDREPGAPSALVARGLAILRTIVPDGGEWLARPWLARRGGVRYPGTR